MWHETLKMYINQIESEMNLNKIFKCGHKKAKTHTATDFNYRLNTGQNVRLLFAVFNYVI